MSVDENIIGALKMRNNFDLSLLFCIALRIVFALPTIAIALVVNLKSDSKK